MKKTHVAVQIWPIGMNIVAVLYFLIVIFCEFPFKISTNAPENYILNQIINQK